MDIPDWMIINAVRYATGRMTYAVLETCDWLVANWSNLPERVRQIIRQDLECEFRRDDMARADPYRAKMILPLGHDCDRAQWERVRRLWGNPKGHEGELHET